MLRRGLWAVVCVGLLAGAVPVSAQVTLEDSATESSNPFVTDGIDDLAFGASTTAGEAIVVVLCAGADATVDITGIADNGSNSYAELIDVRETGGSGAHLWIWYSNGANAAQTVTVTMSEEPQGAFGPSSFWAIAAFGGTDSTPAGDTSSAETTSTMSHDSGNVTTTVADSVLVGSTCGSNGSYTLDADFTEIVTDTSQDVDGTIGYDILTSTGTHSMTNTSTANESTGTGVAEIQGDAGGEEGAPGALLLLGVGR